MSRIGKKPIIIPDKTKIIQSQSCISVEGPEGKMSVDIPPSIEIKITDNKLEVKTVNQENSSLQGLFRSLLSNALAGVVTKWVKVLELSGVGYSASTIQDKLTLNLGFSHPVEIIAPEGIVFQVKENKVSVLGANKYLVGEVAAKIRKIRPPEPYKGKGIHYQGEYIRKKLGKAAKAVGGTGAK